MILRKIGKIITILLGVVVGFFVVMFIAMTIFNSPTYAWRILRYGESDIDDTRIFPERFISNGTNVSLIQRGAQGAPYQVEYPYDGGTRTEVLEELLQRTGTRAFLILKDDQLIYETYLAVITEGNQYFLFDREVLQFGVKIGAAIADGKIGSVDDVVIKYIPEISGRGLDRLTIRDLLLMNSGIRYRHSDEMFFLLEPFGDDALTYYPPDLRKVALSVEASGVPVGKAFRYNNYHMLLEGLIIERATGMHVAEYLQGKFWKPMGAEFPASWSLDSSESGFEKMESGINARAIDYARFGLIFLHNGFWNGVQILPEAWITESTQPIRPDSRVWETMVDVLDYGGYYKYHWWGINNTDGTYDFHSHGKYDQIIYVAPRKNVVIVRLGDRTDENIIWALVIHNLVDQLQ